MCAGAKLILDIGRTLEYLETQGVSVVSFSKSKDFPAFYFPKSGFQSPGNLETVEECARLIYANQEARLNSGMLFAVPIPEEHSPKIGFDAMEKAIQQAVLEAK